MDRYFKINKRKELKEKRDGYIYSMTQAEHKIHKLNAKNDNGEFEKEITRLGRIIDRSRCNLSELNATLAKKETEIPVLLFAINESRMNFNDNYRPMWEYVYYYPDIDEIYKVQKPGLVSLNKEDVDLTSLFTNLEMPEELLFNSIGHDYDNTILEAVNMTKAIIDKIFEENEINDWSEVGTHLKEYVENQTKENGKKNLRLI